MLPSKIYDIEVDVGLVSVVIGMHGFGTVRTKSLVLTTAPIVVLNVIVYIPTSA